MDKRVHFSESVTDKLKHYVYRLIDPRNGTTFYVGRGQVIRVFSHAAGRERPTATEDSDVLKLRTIWAIKNAGFEVQHVIHRHGMDEGTAKEVEAALIDAYPGLTNIQGGSDSSRGVMHADEVVRIYEAPEAKFQHNLILINVNRSSDDQELYDAVRYAWKISPAKARKFDYVLAVRRGLIIGVFKPRDWLPATYERRAMTVLTGTRYDWLRNPAAMEPADRKAFAELRQSGLKTARAWALKETAMAFFDYQYERPARKHFRWWQGWAVRSRLRPTLEVARTLKRRFENIITYLRHRVTNAASESINAKIQWVKYTARGFRNKKNFAAAILFHCGGLDLAP